MAPHDAPLSRIDLNADVGESYGAWTMGSDEALIPLVTSVNVACGAHAVDPLVMARTVDLAVRSGVAIGAHPGYPDRDGFGRRDMDMTDAELEASLLYQLGALAAFVAAAGRQLTHVKPHGALYNRAAADRRLAGVICAAVRRFDPSLTVVALAGSPMVEVVRDAGLALAREAFADRTYEVDGTLRSRRLPFAMMPTPEAAAEQAVSIVTLGKVVSHGGQQIDLTADTLCIHGDTPDAVSFARAVRAALETVGVNAAPLSRPG